MPFSCFLYPAAGYERTYSLGTINIATIIRHTCPKALNRECSLHFLPFTSLRSVTVGSGWFGVGLLGLLEPAVDPVPVVAVVVVQVDAATVEVQAVRVAAAPWEST